MDAKYLRESSYREFENYGFFQKIETYLYRDNEWNLPKSLFFYDMWTCLYSAVGENYYDSDSVTPILSNIVYK